MESRPTDLPQKRSFECRLFRQMLGSGLLARPVHGVLTTMMADGQPHSSLVWCDYDGACACVNTTGQRERGRDMLVNPKVSLLVVGPENTTRYLERGVIIEVTSAAGSIAGTGIAVVDLFALDIASLAIMGTVRLPGRPRHAASLT